MDYHRKYVIATIVLAVAIGFTLWGFNQIQAEAFGGHITMFTKAVFFGSVVTGLVAALCRHYWRNMRNKEFDSQKVAMDALGQIGEQKLQEKKTKKLS